MPIKYKILPIYDSYLEKPEIKKLNNVELLKELPFYDDLSIIKYNTAFSGYVRTCKIEKVEMLEMILLLNTMKNLIKNPLSLK